MNTPQDPDTAKPALHALPAFRVQSAMTTMGKLFDDAFSWRSLRQFVVLFAILIVIAFGSRIVMIEAGKTLTEAHRLEETHKALNSRPALYMTLSTDEILNMAANDTLGGDGYKYRNNGYGGYTYGPDDVRPARKLTVPEQSRPSSPLIDNLKDQSPAPATSGELLGQATEQVSGALDKASGILEEIDKVLKEDGLNPEPKVEIDPESLKKQPFEMVPPSSEPAPAPPEAPKPKQF